MSDQIKDDGGPAMPVPNVNNWYGLSLRDWFAGLAMQGMHTRDPELDFGDIAELAYEQADAMIETRKQ